ncbi:MAG: hypothetical protein GTO18_10810 [Anaerolineales bacterium]|nr:hypothetical protein [Anaerolineales bacterium]
MTTRSQIGFYVGLALSVILIISGIVLIFMGIQGTTELTIGDMELNTGSAGIVIVFLGLVNLWIIMGPYRREAEFNKMSREVMTDLMIQNAVLSSPEELPQISPETVSEEFVVPEMKPEWLGEVGTVNVEGYYDYFESLDNEQLLEKAIKQAGTDRRLENSEVHA